MAAARIPSAQHDRVALLLELVGELTDGGGLPYPVDPDDHDDVGLLVSRQGEALPVARAILRQELCDLTAEDARELGGRYILISGDTLLDTTDDLEGSLHADITGDEDILEFIQHGVIDGTTPSDSACDLGEDILLGLGEPFVEGLLLLFREESK